MALEAQRKRPLQALLARLLAVIVLVAAPSSACLQTAEGPSPDGTNLELSPEQRYLDDVMDSPLSIDFQGSVSEALELGYTYCSYAEDFGWDWVYDDLRRRIDDSDLPAESSEIMRLSAVYVINSARYLLCPEIS